MALPVTNENAAILDAAESLVRDLVHDLRQPLSTIESCACYLKILLRDDQRRASLHLTMIEQQVDEACQLLSAAVADVRRLGVQRTPEVPAADIRSLTKSATAALT
jgi:signal transduction histidine kinase